MTVVRTSVGRDTLHLVVSVLVEVCLQGGEVLVDVMLAPTKEEFCGGNFFLGRLRGGAGRVAWGLRLYFDAAASILVRNHLLRLRHVRLRCLAVDLRSSFLRVRSEDGCPECRPVVGVAICDQSYCSLRVSLSDMCILDRTTLARGSNSPWWMMIVRSIASLSSRTSGLVIFMSGLKVRFFSSSSFDLEKRARCLSRIYISREDNVLRLLSWRPQSPGKSLRYPA